MRQVMSRLCTAVVRAGARTSEGVAPTSVRALCRSGAGAQGRWRREPREAASAAARPSTQPSSL
jgi:hypothetical protein